MSSLPSIERTCVDCTQPFAIPGSERLFREERGLHDPESCPECRLKQRAARNADVVSLYERVRGQSSGNEPRDRRRGPAGRGSQQSPPPQRYNTVCAACGAETQVPFVPRGDRPVYCRSCYNANRGR